MRYLLSTFMNNVCAQGFPWGTLAVNLLGCFLFGVVFALFSKNSSADNTLYLLLATGVCGGFTTFSTFAYESVDHRRTLYWNPNVKTGRDGKAKVEFYNNSSCRQMVISAEGITVEGKVVVAYPHLSPKGKGDK